MEWAFTAFNGICKEINLKGIGTMIRIRIELEYVHNNPVLKNFVTKAKDWQYSSARNWISDDDRVMRMNREILD